MRVKTYRGGSTREVLAKIKAELGEDAVILDTQTRKENGRICCEIMAAIEPDGLPSQPRSESPSSGEWTDWRQEWMHLKENLLGLLKPHMDLSRLSPRQRLVMDHLEREGVAPQGLLGLWNRLKDRPEEPPLTALADMVRIRPWEPSTWPERFHALAGPHGAGKTTTCLRMALRALQDQPGLSVCLVNTDQRQSKGRMFLRHYAELSGLDYREVTAPKDWAQLLRDARRFDRVFIDLPGLPAGSTLDDWLRRQGMGLLEDLRVHLVLSPLYSDRQMDAFLKSHASPALASLVWTKLDEACTFGGMVNASLNTGLPTSALCCGPGLLRTLSPAGDKSFWALVFRHQLPGIAPAPGESRATSERKPARLELRRAGNQ